MPRACRIRKSLEPSRTSETAGRPAAADADAHQQHGVYILYPPGRCIGRCGPDGWARSEAYQACCSHPPTHHPSIEWPERLVTKMCSTLAEWKRGAPRERHARDWSIGGRCCGYSFYVRAEGRERVHHTTECAASTCRGRSTQFATFSAHSERRRARELTRCCNGLRWRIESHPTAEQARLNTITGHHHHHHHHHHLCYF
ncbi:hypothetical protein IWX49DRAFT_8648 [Phyllosticta citricarpa]